MAVESNIWLAVHPSISYVQISYWSTIFDTGIIFYTAKIMVLSQNPAQSMKKLRLSSKKTVKRCIVNYTKMLFRTKKV